MRSKRSRAWHLRKAAQRAEESLVRGNTCPRCGGSGRGRVGSPDHLTSPYPCWRCGGAGTREAALHVEKHGYDPRAPFWARAQAAELAKEKP